MKIHLAFLKNLFHLCVKSTLRAVSPGRVFLQLTFNQKLMFALLDGALCILRNRIDVLISPLFSRGLTSSLILCTSQLQRYCHRLFPRHAGSFTTVSADIVLMPSAKKCHGARPLHVLME